MTRPEQPVPGADDPDEASGEHDPPAPGGGQTGDPDPRDPGDHLPDPIDTPIESDPDPMEPPD